MFYSLLYSLFFLVTVPFVLLSPHRRDKYLSNFRQRLGRQDYPQRDGRPSIWIHGVSVGEVMTVKALVRALRETRPEYAILVSTTTLAGDRVAREHLTADGYFFFPFDWCFAVRRVCRAIEPRLCLVIESEFWPNFLRVLERRQVRMLLINGRISDRSFGRYRRLRFLIGPLLRRFTFLAAQSRLDGERLVAVGAPQDRVRISGNLKNHEGQFAVASHVLRELSEKLGAGPWFVAGSTHDGEEQIVLHAFKQARAASPDLKLLLVPRKPHRFDQVADWLADSGIDFQRFSALPPNASSPTVNLVLVDTLGLLMPLYRLARVAFVGGSLVKRGGHNPLEACAAGIPVLFGPHMFNFREVRDGVIERGAGFEVADEAGLTARLITLLENENLRRQIGAAGLQVIEENSHALGRTLDLIGEVLGESKVKQPK